MGACCNKPETLGQCESATKCEFATKWETELKDEAVRIFNLADRDGNGFLDMDELANVRNSKEFAQAMMGQVDDNADGHLSLDEWLIYVKKIFDKKEKTCATLLKLYEKQIGQNVELK